MVSSSHDAAVAVGPVFSRLIYGTWRLLNDAEAVTPQAVNRRLQVCLEQGITTIDTAEIYGGYEVEEVLGRALALSPGLRDRLQLVTKYGIYVPSKFHPQRKVAFYNAEGARAVKSLEKSLWFLGTDFVDLLLVHRPDWLTSADDTASGLNRLLEGGKIRHAGVSNYNVQEFELLNSRMRTPLVANQIEFHLLHQQPMRDGTLNQCERLRVLPMAWSPLAGGRLLDPAHEAGGRVAAAVRELGAKYGGATLEQLAYAWILAHPARPAVVLGTNKVERILNAVKALELRLEREDWYALREAAEGKRIP